MSENVFFGKRAYLIQPFLGKLWQGTQARRQSSALNLLDSPFVRRLLLWKNKLLNNSG
jgi:hypothetical protein